MNAHQLLEECLSRTWKLKVQTHPGGVDIRVGRVPPKAQAVGEMEWLQVCGSAECGVMTALEDALRNIDFRLDQAGWRTPAIQLLTWEELAKQLMEADIDAGCGFYTDPTWQRLYNEIARRVGVGSRYYISEATGILPQVYPRDPNA